MAASWRVGAILNETLADTLRFAGWYLDQGADAMTLFFDDPRDPAIGILGRHPGITCIACRPEFWVDRGLTQDTRFPKRQNAALTWLYPQVGEEWLLNVDADEFLYVRDGRIGDLLAMQDPDTDYLRIETAEAVGVRPEGLERACFRLPMDRDAARRVYGRSAALFGPRRRGLVGHPQGKSAIRSGLPGVNLRQHWPQRAGGRPLQERQLGRENGVFLLHRIGLDFATWRRKLDWRSTSRGFTTGLTDRVRDALASAEAESLLLDLHADLHTVDAGRVERLRSEGCWLELDLDLDAPAQRHFGAEFPGT